LSKINDIKSILIFIRKSVDSVFIDENFDKYRNLNISIIIKSRLIASPLIIFLS
jgi:hypothetical protein